jgi:hypothetical protein
VWRSRGHLDLTVDSQMVVVPLARMQETLSARAQFSVGLARARLKMENIWLTMRGIACATFHELFRGRRPLAPCQCRFGKPVASAGEGAHRTEDHGWVSEIFSCCSAFPKLGSTYVLPYPLLPFPIPSFAFPSAQRSCTFSGTFPEQLSFRRPGPHRGGSHAIRLQRESTRISQREATRLSQQGSTRLCLEEGLLARVHEAALGKPIAVLIARCFSQAEEPGQPRQSPHSGVPLGRPGSPAA